MSPRILRDRKIPEHVAAGHAKGIVFLEFVFINAPQFAIEKTKTL
jgi:hypothetical protein